MDINITKNIGLLKRLKPKSQVNKLVEYLIYLELQPNNARKRRSVRILLQNELLEHCDDKTLEKVVDCLLVKAKEWENRWDE